MSRPGLWPYTSCAYLGVVLVATGSAASRDWAEANTCPHCRPMFSTPWSLSSHRSSKVASAALLVEASCPLVLQQHSLWELLTVTEAENSSHSQGCELHKRWVAESNYCKFKYQPSQMNWPNLLLGHHVMIPSIWFLHKEPQTQTPIHGLFIKN